MAAVSKVWHQIENPTQSIYAYLLYLKNFAAKFHPNPIRNNGALGFLKRSPQEE